MLTEKMKFSGLIHVIFGLVQQLTYRRLHLSSSDRVKRPVTLNKIMNLSVLLGLLLRSLRLST